MRQFSISGLICAGVVHSDQGQNQQVRLGGIGELVAQELSRRLHRDVRTVVLGHLQRGGEPTPFDRVLATQFGAHAVRLVHQGQLGEMVCYKPPHLELSNQELSNQEPPRQPPHPPIRPAHGVPDARAQRGPFPSGRADGTTR